MTNFNERTNTLLYKSISLTKYSRKGWCWLCVRGELETGTEYYILTQSSSDYSSTSFSSWLGLLNRGSLRAPTAGSHVGNLSPTDSNSNWFKPSVSWLYFCLTPTCIRCSSAYLHGCISWLMARSRVNLLRMDTAKHVKILDKSGGNSHKLNSLGKVMNYSPYSKAYIVGQTGLLILD